MDLLVKETWHIAKRKLSVGIVGKPVLNIVGHSCYSVTHGTARLVFYAFVVSTCILGEILDKVGLTLNPFIHVKTGQLRDWELVLRQHTLESRGIANQQNICYWKNIEPINQKTEGSKCSIKFALAREMACRTTLWVQNLHDSWSSPSWHCKMRFWNATLFLLVLKCRSRSNDPVLAKNSPASGWTRHWYMAVHNFATLAACWATKRDSIAAKPLSQGWVCAAVRPMELLIGPEHGIGFPTSPKKTYESFDMASKNKLSFTPCVWYAGSYPNKQKLDFVNSPTGAMRESITTDLNWSGPNTKVCDSTCLEILLGSVLGMSSDGIWEIWVWRSHTYIYMYICI